MLSHAFSIIIDRGISVPGHDREVVVGPNELGENFIFRLTSSVKLPGANNYDTQMVICTVTCTSDVSLTR